MKSQVNISLKFDFDKPFIALHTLTHIDENHFIPNIPEDLRKEVRDFQNFAWDISQDAYTFFDGRGMETKIQQVVDGTLSFEKMGKQIDEFLPQIINSDELTTVYNHVVKSSEDIKKEWEGDYKFSKDFIESLGISLTGEFTIKLVSPAFWAGTNMGNNTIKWSYKTLWPHYNTIYLWHEVLHSYFGKSDAQHALIQLIADNELRRLLDGTEYPPFAGHKFLRKNMEQINPSFQEYLQKKDKDMKEFIKALPKE